MRGMLIFACGVAVFSLPQFSAADAPMPDAAKGEIRFAHLGQKRDQLIAKFGEPKNATRFASGIESMEFQNGANRMLVEISPKTQQLVQIYYRKKTPFTDGQVMELLNRNTEGKQWVPAKEAGVFIRSDGGIARGSGNGTSEKDAAKVGDEYQFAVLSGSEVMNKSPDIAATRKKEVEDELKELAGF